MGKLAPNGSEDELVIDEAAALAAILRELPDATPDTPLREHERIEAICCCRETFAIRLVTREMDFAMTPSEIAGVVARAAQDQFMG